MANCCCKDLVAAMALAQAYMLAKESCVVCGRPATFQQEDRGYLTFRCDTCPALPPNAPPYENQKNEWELTTAAAVRRLTAISEAK